MKTNRSGNARKPENILIIIAIVLFTLCVQEIRASLRGLITLSIPPASDISMVPMAANAKRQSEFGEGKFRHDK